jgi:HK97 family phage prohead protease
MTDLNLDGQSHARSLIAAGRVDRNSDWSFTAEDGNKLLGPTGDDWMAYGNCHLGIDHTANENTKARYKYPFAKGGKLYRSALTAIRQRAGQNGDGPIERAAGDLIERVDAAEKKSASSSHERRMFGDLEKRAQGDGKPTIIVGYAARFNRQANINGCFIEQIAPGAFAQSIIDDDVRCLANHDPNLVLGRNRSGTLALSEDAVGLRFECQLADTQAARDIAVSIERGDISQCSFAFDAVQEEWDFSGELPLRTLRQCRLYDVSPVTYPAYEDTTVAVRSLDAARAAMIEQERAKRRHNFNAASLRIRLRTKLDLLRRSAAR